MNIKHMCAGVVLCAAVASGCDDTPTGPSSGAIVTFAVANEIFRVRLTTEEQVAAAWAAV